MKTPKATNGNGHNKAALIYCRVSTRSQQEEGTSLETQADACVKHAESLGYSAGRITKEVYSGVELWDRPQLARDRADIKAKQFQALVCYATDRLSRDPIHLAIIAEECERAGCELIFVTELMDSSPEAGLIRYVKGYAAKIEHAKIKERSLRGKMAKLKSGKLIPSRKALYGYRNDAESGKRVVYESEAFIVRQMYGWVSEGMGIIQVRARLFQENVLPPAGKQLQDGHAALWPLSTLQKILRDPAYKGETYAGQFCAPTPMNQRKSRRDASEHIRLPDDVTPPIVSLELWNTVQHRLDTNRGDMTRNQARQYLLRGLAYCAKCGRKMYSDLTHGFRYYRCSSKVLDAQPCGGGVSRADKVEEAVWQQVMIFLQDPERSLAELRRQQGSGIDPQLIEDRQTAMRRLADIERKQERQVRRLRDAEDEDLIQLYERDIADLQNTKKQLKQFIDQIDERLRAKQKSAIDFEALTDYCARIADALSSFSFDEKRLALEAVGARVILKGNEWKLETRIPCAPDAASNEAAPVGKVIAMPIPKSIPSGSRATSSKPGAMPC